MVKQHKIMRKMELIYKITGTETAVLRILPAILSISAYLKHFSN